MASKNSIYRIPFGGYDTTNELQWRNGTTNMRTEKKKARKKENKGNGTEGERHGNYLCMTFTHLILQIKYIRHPYYRCIQLALSPLSMVTGAIRII